MKKILVVASAACILAVADNSAQASLVLDGSATFTSAGSGNEAVNYFVDYSGGVYTYAYEFVQPPTILNFEVNASYVSGVLLSGNPTIAALAIADLGGSPALQAAFVGANTLYAGAAVLPGTVTWVFPSFGAAGSSALAFTSVYGPGWGTGSLIDEGTGPWGDNPGSGGTPIPVPAPVPEASTIFAGLLMIAPLGVGAIRALRKERLA